MNNMWHHLKQQTPLIALLSAMLFLLGVAIALSLNQQSVLAEGNQQQVISTTGVHLIDLQAIPKTVKVSDTFRLSATIINNSTNTISFIGGCESPLSATFDQHVSTEQSPHCLAIQ